MSGVRVTSSGRVAGRLRPLETYYDTLVQYSGGRVCGYSCCSVGKTKRIFSLQFVRAIWYSVNCRAAVTGRGSLRRDLRKRESC